MWPNGFGPVGRDLDGAGAGHLGEADLLVREVGVVRGAEHAVDAQRRSADPRDAEVGGDL